MEKCLLIYQKTLNTYFDQTLRELIIRKKSFNSYTKYQNGQNIKLVPKSENPQNTLEIKREV